MKPASRGSGWPVFWLACQVAGKVQATPPLTMTVVIT